ncbi:MAG: lipocalin family protein [Chitinophagaceae bacterium]
MRAIISIVMLTVLMSSCASIPKKAVAVHPFDKTKYLGKWYEIARLDFRFERNLNNTTAEYTLRRDGKIKVDNKGYNYRKNEWKQSVGKAKFRGEDTIGKLKVSFFGPFYAGYNVIAIDKNYQYALVAGRNTDYLWILSRTIIIPEEVKNNYIDIAKRIGYNTDDLVWVKHDKL